MNEHELHDFVVEAKKIAPLGMRQLHFLVGWKEIADFNFKEVKGLQAQLEMAIQFFLEAEKDWQEKVSLNNTDLTFFEFFYMKARFLDIDLPDNFIEQMTKGDTDEFERTREMGIKSKQE